MATVYIQVEGGVVTDVTADDTNTNIDVCVIDWDNIDDDPSFHSIDLLDRLRGFRPSKQRSRIRRLLRDRRAA